jgi:hypothetical protein
MKTDEERLKMYDAAIDAKPGHRDIQFGMDFFAKTSESPILARLRSHRS